MTTLDYLIRFQLLISPNFEFLTQVVKHGYSSVTGLNYRFESNKQIFAVLRSFQYRNPVSSITLLSRCSVPLTFRLTDLCPIATYYYLSPTTAVKRKIPLHSVH